jgi:23S rRNA U2552 (ribose-2'-O)-methylase RlmE/FtsJ
MADFVQSANVKSAVRKLAEPIVDVATFNTIVQSVITTNPFECVAYMTAGESHPPVEMTKEAYTAKLVYQDTNAKTVGTGSHKFDTLAKFNAGVTALLAAAAVSTAHGGTVVRDADKEMFSATLKCHDANGEIYTVNFSRDQITITSYEDDAIRTNVETWADTVAALA